MASNETAAVYIKYIILLAAAIIVLFLFLKYMGPIVTTTAPTTTTVKTTTTINLPAVRSESEILKLRGMCNNLTDPGQKANCLYSIADRLNDPSVCNEITSTLLKDKCLMKYGLLDPTKNCLNLSGGEKNNCITNAAVISKKSGICSSIEDNFAKDVCYWRYASATGDISVCDKIGVERIRSGCSQVMKGG